VVSECTHEFIVSEEKMFDNIIKCRNCGMDLSSVITNMCVKFTKQSKYTELGRSIKDIRPEVIWFAQQMEIKLKANDHKGGWQQEDIKWLLQRLRQETDELELWIEQFNETPSKTVAEKVILKSADVANFAMMIADICPKRAKLIGR